MDDLAIIVISTNEAHWLGPCLRSVLEHAGELTLDLIVVDNESTDGSAELLAREFPGARVVPSKNRGFGHANNRGIEVADARYVLFLNCDTEVREGTFAELVTAMDARPRLGIAGLRQVLPDGSVFPTIRRFPSVRRALAEALSLQRLRPSWGERVVEPAAYDRETPCDWTIGATMVARREALAQAGWFDEDYFMSSEDTDLCRRVRGAGFEISHLPVMTITHYVHGGDHELGERMYAQYALSRRLYAVKHFRGVRRRAYLAATALRYVLRAPLGPPRRTGLRARLRELSGVLALLAGRGTPPFGNQLNSPVVPS